MRVDFRFTDSAVVKQFFKNVLTEGDNATFDLLRIVGLVGVNVFFILSLMNWTKFTPESWGIGFGTVMVAAAGAFRINEGAAGKEHSSAAPPA